MQFDLSQRFHWKLWDDKPLFRLAREKGFIHVRSVFKVWMTYSFEYLMRNYWFSINHVIDKRTKITFLHFTLDCYNTLTPIMQIPVTSILPINYFLFSMFYLPNRSRDFKIVNESNFNREWLITNEILPKLTASQRRRKSSSTCQLWSKLVRHKKWRS